MRHEPIDGMAGRRCIRANPSDVAVLSLSLETCATMRRSKRRDRHSRLAAEYIRLHVNYSRAERTIQSYRKRLFRNATGGLGQVSQLAVEKEYLPDCL